MLDNKFWNKYFQDYDILNMLVPYTDLLDSLCTELDIKSGENILDVGSGTGNLALKMKKFGAVVQGLELSTQGIARHIKKDPEASVVEGDITKRFPFEDESFDKVVSNNTLYTIPLSNRDGVVREMFRILKPGGKIVISNIFVGFSPIKIYVSHIGLSIKRDGLVKTILSIFKLAPPTIRMFKYNALIKKESRGGEYSFLEHDEQKDLLKKNGFKDISDTLVVYAGQGVLNSGHK